MVNTTPGECGLDIETRSTLGTVTAGEWDVGHSLISAYQNIRLGPHICADTVNYVHTFYSMALTMPTRQHKYWKCQNHLEANYSTCNVPCQEMLCQVACLHARYTLNPGGGKVLRKQNHVGTSLYLYNTNSVCVCVCVSVCQV